MPFKEGESGNPAGRPVGVPNKVSISVKSVLKAYQDEYKNSGLLHQDLAKVKPIERLNFYLSSLAFTTPKLTSTNITIDPDKMSDAELNAELNAEFSKYIGDGTDGEN